MLLRRLQRRLLHEQAAAGGLAITEQVTGFDLLPGFHLQFVRCIERQLDLQQARMRRRRKGRWLVLRSARAKS